MKRLILSSVLLGFLTMMQAEYHCATGLETEGLLPSLQSGDLLFQIRGAGEMSAAIDASTSSDGAQGFAHVGMVIESGGNLEVIEASPREGVRIVNLNEFLADSPQVEGRPGVVAKRLDIPFRPEAVVGNAISHLGEPYDWYYLPDNGMMYCSELIYEAFVDGEGSHIFKSVPMRFRDADGNMPEFWTRLYEKLEMEVPEGTPGTNPNDLSADPRLREVCRFF